jgi:hypothetical protein
MLRNTSDGRSALFIPWVKSVTKKRDVFLGCMWVEVKFHVDTNGNDNHSRKE